jgi:mRNA interferase MazF
MKPGAIVLVRFPFTSLERAKKRPALVLSVVKHSTQIQLVTFAMITSKLDGFDLEGDVPLKDWSKAHLLHSSLIRLSKLATIDAELVERELGHMSEGDAKEVCKVFRKLYRNWV